MKKYLWMIPFISFIAGYLLLDISYNQELDTPTLVGKSIQESFIIVSSHNLNARLLGLKEDAELPEGTIISQTPGAGQKIKKNQSVFVVVSTKPKKIKAPNFLMQTQKTVNEMIAKNNIHIVSRNIESNYPQGQCFSQKPAPGNYLEKNNMILYFSDTTHKTVLIPDMKNKPLSLALDFLTHHNVKTDVIGIPESYEKHLYSDYIVIDQRPLSGSLVTLDPEKPLHMHIQVREQLN